MTRGGYEEVREHGVRALEEGRYEDALDAFRQALAVAERGGELERIHAARCNVSLALWQLERTDEAKQGLREIILASQEDRTVAAAALWHSAILSREQNFERALQYLGIARQRASAAGDRKLETSAHIGVGNIRLNLGEHEEALACYEQAAALIGDDPEARMEWAVNRKNEGYVLALMGRFREAFAALNEALAIARDEDNSWVVALTYQDQAYAYLLRNHLRRAEKAALHAIAVSRKHGYADVMKNACFIVMEVSIRQDESAKFDLYFEKLQDLMPNIRLSKSFFRMFDITDILNLREA